MTEVVRKRLVWMDCLQDTLHGWCLIIRWSHWLRSPPPLADDAAPFPAPRPKAITYTLPNIFHIFEQ